MSAPSNEIAKTELVTLKIDGIETSVAKGTLVIRAAEQLGIQIPRFCDHPLMAPVGACRQCLVEVAMPGPDGELRTMMGPPGRVKPQASCTLPVSEGMEVKTQLTSPIADKAQQGIMEHLLVNHPLDCPMCDKGGECPLQNQAMSNGRGESRFLEQKRTFPKPIHISAQVLLDRERCVLCARCTRFSDEISGDLLGEAGAAGAQHAALAVEQHLGGDVDRLREGPLGLGEPGLAAAVRHRLVLQRALAALVAHRAVERVVDQQELHDPLLRLVGDLRGGLRVDHHAGRDGDRA